MITELGVGTEFRFAKGSYGPFAPEVKLALHELANKNWLREEQLGKMTAVRVGEQYERDRSKFADVIQRHRKWIDKTVDLFSRVKNTDQAEDVTTVLFASRELKKSETRGAGNRKRTLRLHSGLEEILADRRETTRGSQRNSKSGDARLDALAVQRVSSRGSVTPLNVFAQ